MASTCGVISAAAAPCAIRAPTRSPAANANPYPATTHSIDVAVATGSACIVGTATFATKKSKVTINVRARATGSASHRLSMLLCRSGPRTLIAL